MDPGLLASALKSRKKYVEESADAVVVGIGTNGDLRSTSSTGACLGMQFTEKSATGHTGLLNQGATCYLNSLLQSLYMIPEFRAALYSWPYVSSEHGEDELCLTRQLQRLFVQLQLSARGAVPTVGLTKSFGWNSSESFVQHDVQECMTVMFDFMTSQCMGSELGWYISDQMMGESFNELTCQHCNSKRRRTEHFRDLQLQVRGMRSLAESLRAYLSTETLEGVECDGPCCAEDNKPGRHDHRSRVGVSRLPNVLTLQLRRFDINYETMQRIKLNDRFEFPLSFNFNDFLQPGDADGSEVPQEYELMSVLVHTGSAYAGHYYAYIREQSPSQHGGPGFSSRWLMFNDSTVTELDEAALSAILDHSPGAGADPSPEDPSPDSCHGNPIVKSPSNAYMLVYRKKSEANLTHVAEDCIPNELTSAIRADNKSYLEMKARRDHERAFMHLQVCHRSATKLVRAHESTTVKQFTNIAFDAFRDHVEDGFEFPFSRESVRLRVFDPIKTITLSPSEFGSNSEATLKSIPDHIMGKVFHFEILWSPRMSFQPPECASSSVRVELVLYDPADSTFQGPLPVLLSEASLMVDACAYLTDLLGNEAGSAAVTTDEDTEVPRLLPWDSTTVGSRLQHDQTIYIESPSRDSTSAGCGLLEYFQKLRPRISVKVSMPDSCRYAEALVLSADVSSTLLDFKAELSGRIGIPVDAFSLHKRRDRLVEIEGSACASSATAELDVGSKVDIGPGEELKDLSVAVSTVTATTGAADEHELEVCLQRPLLVGQFRVAVLIDSSTVDIASEPSAAAVGLSCVGALVVDSDEIVQTVKTKIRRMLQSQSVDRVAWESNVRLRVAEVVQGPQLAGNISAFSKHAVNIQLFGNGAGDMFELKLTNKILIDNNTMGREMRDLRDGSVIVCQLNVPEAEFTCDSILVNAHYWDIDTMELSALGDIIIDKDTRVVDLKAQFLLLCEKYSGVSRMSGQDNESHELSIVRPFTWQLNDVANIPEMKWEPQPSDSAYVTAPPLRLASGSSVLCTDSARLHSLLVEAAAAHHTRDGEGPESGEGIAEQTRGGSTTTPVGGAFRILSVAEQIEINNSNS